MAQIVDATKTPAHGAMFREAWVEADGFRVRYMEAGRDLRWFTCMARADCG